MLKYLNEGIVTLKVYWKLNFLLSWIDVRMSLTWARLLLPGFEKSVFSSAVSCTSQKHRLLECVSILLLSSYASSGQLPEVSGSQVPYTKSGTIIGLLLTLNGLGSRKLLAQVQPHNASHREVLLLFPVDLLLHPIWSSNWITGKTLMAVTLLNPKSYSQWMAKCPITLRLVFGWEVEKLSAKRGVCWHHLLGGAFPARTS